MVVQIYVKVPNITSCAFASLYPFIRYQEHRSKKNCALLLKLVHAKCVRCPRELHTIYVIIFSIALLLVP
jgi:hypothetical protein